MTRRGLVSAAVLLGGLTASHLAGAAPSWSIGGSLGGGKYSNERFNASDLIDDEAIRSGHEFGASLRCEISPWWAVELEATHMSGSADIAGGPMITPPNSGGPILESPLPLTIQTELTAIPLNVLYRVTGFETVSFRALAGGGILTGAHWESSWSGPTEDITETSKSVTRPYAQAGIETAWHVQPRFELAARVLGRLAQANHVLDATGNDLAIDHTGVAFALGARLGLSH